MNSTATDVRFQQMSSAMSSRVENETILLSVEKGKYFSIGDVGTLIWDCLKEPVTRDQIQEAVMKTYDVDAQTCAADIEEFLGKMLEMQLVEEVTDVSQ